MFAGNCYIHSINRIYTMDKIINKYLKAKHWQIFLLTVGIPFIFYMVSMFKMFGSIAYETSSDSDPFDIFYLGWFMVVLLATMILGAGWAWSIGVGIQKYIPQELRLNLTRFKIFFIFIVVYYLFIILIFINNFLLMDQIGPYMPLIIIPHLFAMFCTFYCLYFISRSIKTADVQRKVGFSDYAGEFFLLWYFPIGIWFVQPKINKVVQRGVGFNPGEDIVVE